ncbi:MAG TPA: hypothetical protein VMB78_11600 [Dissulfurispiraceae bacterium]|nr:hypothetical protein [Dissulfurispiraceae bacterium]
MKSFIRLFTLLLSLIFTVCDYSFPAALQADTTLNPAAPAQTARLIFIHHSTGQNWLADDNGNLGIALKNNNYFVSDTNYGWGPNSPYGDSIGSHTDIGDWWLWFRSGNSTSYMSALYPEGGQHCSYSRLSSAPAADNEIIMFKSCFPNSALRGNPSDPVPTIADNPLKGVSSGSDYHTVANAKGIYIDILEYFRQRQDKLFIVIAAPPLQDITYAANARAFNQWLVNDWLKDYTYNNVFVFDFYNVLTTNGGNPNTNDLGWATGNHHRWKNSAIEHKTDGGSDINKYPSGDDHPTAAGGQKATAEFLPLLNIAYNCYKSTGGCPAANICSAHFRTDGVTSNYDSIQAVYDALLDNKTLQIHETILGGNLLMDINKTVTLDGGYVCNFSTSPGFTIIRDNLTITAGTAIVGNLIIE